MNIHLRPDQESELAKLAHRIGRSADQIAQDAIDALLEHDAWFSGQVAKGVGQLDRGEAISHDQVVAGIDRLFRS